MYVPYIYIINNTLLFTYSTNILVTLLKMAPHDSQSSCEIVSSSSGTSLLASYKEVPPPPPPEIRPWRNEKQNVDK